MQWIVNNQKDLEAIAPEFWEQINHPVILFQGDLGAGKTTFISALVKFLGTDDHISSPTFSLVNEYETEKDTVYHFDFYRIQDEEEAFDMGAEEYLYSGNYCLIEWPEKILNLIPEDYHKVTIAVENGKRIIKLDE